ncbi:STAS-like domain-containing protein [Paenibacillus borealis]|uniref:DUF4325 domain-containing protein n=1 Tax=Paenibacillus borealis TaxID=160799 RepID=A0A089LDS3_PAEBO|nr:STAS-like domain-containing protein [Paenibacillus borealis]AIQ59666.1 hypothetical protein PBOR_23940 [Paenibacillus borealis]
MGRLLRLGDHVNHCYSNAEGEAVQDVLRKHFDTGDSVIVSFKGMDSVSSSFINSAFIELLEVYDFTFIKEHLGFADTTRTINDQIKRRFSFEANNKLIRS